MATYSYRDHLISIVPCSKEDIPSHIERVLSYWESTGTNIDYQKTLLEACVDAETAVKVLDESGKCLGCLYWKPLENESEYIIHYLWFKNSIIVGIMIDYAYRHTYCKTVMYVPHQRNKISYAKFLTRNNIMSFYSKNSAVVVNIRNPKIMKIYKKYFADNPNVKEV